MYRLYDGPGSRFLDMFGLLGNRRSAFTEHAALDGITLDIRRGEKVAFIGRNGAGKSTLLKLITKVIEPTSGALQVEGKVHALLQIGTGFHPDFTGRENVLAYLAQLGVTGREAERKYTEIVEFAELEEYIGQPVKTYSSGMAVRLMFSTATAITPELLVLDEVLGVGDAYFAHKSYQRMQEMAERDGTTLLLVTHDIYSAVRLCNRVIWIDRGRVLMDGEGPAVVTAYEDSIRQQEEQRLRKRHQERMIALTSESAVAAPAPGPTSVDAHLIFEIQAKHNAPQPCPVYFSRIALEAPDSVIELPLADGSGRSLAESHLELEGTCWGEPTHWQGRDARPLQNYGSPFHKITGVFVLPDTIDLQRSRIKIDYWSDVPCDLVLRAFVHGRELRLGPLPPVATSWTAHAAPLDVEASGALDATLGVSLNGRQGTGAIAIDDVRTLDVHGESSIFRHGEPFTLLVRYRIHQPNLSEHAQVLIAIHRDGVLDVCRIFTRQLRFDALTQPRGVIRLDLPRLYLANGTYTLTVMVAKEGYYDRQQTQYFSLNPEVYTCLSRVVEIVVTDGGIVGSGTGVVGEGTWSLQAEVAAEAAGS